MTNDPGGLRKFAGLVETFISSPEFERLAENSKQLWGRELREAGDLDSLGIYSLKEMRPSLVQKYLDGLAGRPGKQFAALTAIKALDRWAIRRDFLTRQITFGVKTERPEGGHVPWTDAQVSTAERVCRKDLARAITLGACTGQRISDLVRMSWNDIEKYKGHEGINLTQLKTGRQIWIPVNEKLCAALDSWGRKDVGPILLRDGKPWQSQQHLTDLWSYEKRVNDGLREHRNLGLVMHGLRGYRCVTLSRQGLTDHQIGDLVGMSVGMVSRYTRLSNQRDNALAAHRNLK